MCDWSNVTVALAGELRKCPHPIMYTRDTLHGAIPNSFYVDSSATDILLRSNCRFGTLLIIAGDENSPLHREIMHLLTPLRVIVIYSGAEPAICAGEMQKRRCRVEKGAGSLIVYELKIK